MSRFLFFLSLYTIILSGCSETDTVKPSSLTYKELSKDHIFSGFGASLGDPLTGINKIPAIQNPTFTNVKEGLYSGEELCIGMEIKGQYYFASLRVLNTREIVTVEGRSICFCPLAGLALGVGKPIVISGLLRYDTFVLYDKRNKSLVLAYDLSYPKIETENLNFVSLYQLQYKGVLKHFKNAKILDPRKYPARNPYGTYSMNMKCGIGHPKPVDMQKYKEAIHPKDRVLIVYEKGKPFKAYPLSEVKKTLENKSGSFEDGSISVVYDVDTDYLYIKRKKGLSQVYAYYFAVRQNLPNLKIYSF
jgi:hypothetical protein